MKLLVVEDDQRLAELLSRGLKSSGHVVDVAGCAAKGWRLVDDGHYDVIILDVKLPDEDGFSLCQRLRKAQVQTPVMMLTARDSIDDKVTGLSSGADDYLTKPFSFAELNARLSALQRRLPQFDGRTVVRVGKVELQPDTFVVKQDGVPIDLTAREFALLELLMRNAGHVMTKEVILNRVWSTDADPVANVVEAVIARLRQKLNINTKGKPFIKTVRGLGYKVEA